MSKQNPSTGAVVAIGLAGLVLGIVVVGLLIIPGLQPQLGPSSNGVTTFTNTSASKGQILQVSIVPRAGSDTTLSGYSPDVITVVIGTNSTITWTNNDSVPHTVTVRNSALNSGNLGPGQTFSYTFTSPGMYEYICEYHAWMHGTVIVKGA